MRADAGAGARDGKGSAPMTWRGILDAGVAGLRAAGIREAELDGWYLFEAAFGMDRAHFIMDQRRAAGGADFEGKRELFDGYIRRRQRRIPLQHILGNQEFMGLHFFVNEHVLIPRQDTETLVEEILKDCLAGELKSRLGREPRILDMCTGSGCIAVSLARLGGYGRVTGADISPEALRVAGINGASICGEHGPSWALSDLYGSVPGTFDIIASNPPYIPSRVIEELEPEVKDHEPRRALDGGGDGLFFYRRMAEESAAHLTDGGRLYLEIGCEQAADVTGLLREAGYENIQVIKDGPGLDRVVKAVRPQAGGLHV